MAALKITLIGAPDTGVPQLASVLDDAVKASAWQALVVIADSAAMPADLGSFDLVLLMGLEHTSQSGIRPIGADTPSLSQEAADQSIRAALANTAVSYQVLYGGCDERLAQALLAIQSLLPDANVSPRQGTPSGGAKNQPWVWMCDKCSDSQCEHRLLTALLLNR